MKAFWACLTIGVCGWLAGGVAGAQGRVALPLRIEPPLKQGEVLKVSDIGYPPTSLQALASQLSVDDITLLLQANDPSASMLNGYSMSRTGNLALSLAFLTQALQAFPDDPEIRNLRMDVSLASGNAALAVEDALWLERGAKAEDAAGLSQLIVLAALAREERWQDLIRYDIREFDQPILNFIAQGLWTFATLDQVSTNDGLSRAAQVFSIGGFEDRKSYLIALAAVNRGEIALAFEGFDEALQKMNLGVQRPAIWAYRAASYADQDAIADQLMQNLRVTAQRTFALNDMLDFEAPLSLDPPSKREMVAEMLMQLAWLFAQRSDGVTARLMADLAWVVDGGDTRSSAPLTQLRASLAGDQEDHREHLSLAGDFPDAMALTRLREQTLALLALGRSDEAIGRVEQALANAVETGENHDNSVLIHRLLGMKARLQSRSQRYPEALASFANWAQYGTDNGIEPMFADWLNHFQWAIAHFWEGEQDAMESRIEQALALNPGNPFATNFLAYSWVDRGVHLDQGLEMLLAANAASPGRASIIDSVGWAYYRQGDLDKALLFLEQAWQIESSSWEICAHLGDVYADLGRNVEARWFWQRALGLEAIPADRASLIEEKLASQDN